MSDEEKPQRSRARGALILLSGLGVGILVSIIAYTCFKPENVVMPVLIAKLVIGIILLMMRETRRFSAGLLLSIAIGALIFLGTCGGVEF
ncbi:MAG TPA: hypothetical protein VIL86_03760 [Tepidisphaeraceae bacterium]|jgi:hypothetical protein